MSTIPGGDEPREDQTNPDQPPAVPEPPVPAEPEPPAPLEEEPPLAPEPPSEPEPVTEPEPLTEPEPAPAFEPPAAPPFEPPAPAPAAAPPSTPPGAYPPPPAPGYQQPAPGYQPPPPGYQAPPPGYQPPPPGYQPPPPGYQAPPPGYQGPPPGYQQAPGYQAPPAGYGYQQAPPPNYPPPPVGYAAGVAQPSLFGVALSDGWKAFQRVWGPIVGAMVVWFLAALVVLSIVAVIFGGWGRIFSASTNGLRGFTGVGFTFAGFVLGIVSAIIVALIQAQFVRVALTVTRGHRPAFAEFFRIENAGPVAVLALIIGVAEGVLRSIPILGTLAVIVLQFFLLLAYFILIDRRVAPVDAIRESVDMMTRNAGQTIVFYLLAAVIVIVGAILCGIGLLVAVPWVLLATTYLYRRLTGEQPQLPA